MPNQPESPAPASLVVTADDYGYRPSYDAGILEAVEAGAVDAVSAMVMHEVNPAPLLETRVEVGLHLELEQMPDHVAAGPVERDAALDALHGQLARFEALFGHQPVYLDGHHHCHARVGLAPDIARIAAARNMPVRSVGPRHRRLLRGVGVPTPDRLVGRTDESEPPVPEELAAVLDGGEPPPGVTEWMVHPGHRDPQEASSFDAAREQDLELVVDLSDELGRAFQRGTHAALLAR
jgi:chitin disaccharide deacetylase